MTSFESAVRSSKPRITCRKGDTSASSSTYFANVWGPRPGPFMGRPMLGHGEGATRAEAIRNAKADALKNGGAK